MMEQINGGLQKMCGAQATGTRKGNRLARNDSRV